MNPPNLAQPSAFRRLGASLVVLGLSVWLAGCSLAPGLYAAITQESPQGVPGSALSGRSAWVTTSATPAAGALEAPPPGQLIPITADLIKQQRSSRPSDLPEDIRQLFGTPKPYTIGSGDVLNIVVWDHPELSVPAAGGLATDATNLSGVGNGYNVSPDGFIQFPYIGTVKLLGLTEYEVRDLIVKRLAKVIKDPQVTVRIQSFRSSRVYVDGEVRLPGLQPVTDVPMTLPEVIGRAGGFTATADRSSISITRNDSTIMVSLPMLTERGINPAKILLGSGDLVRVLAREEAKVFVMGEVLRPSAQTLRNGRLTLNEALGDSGGINQASADPRQIFVIRAANALKPEIYHLDAHSPAAFALAEGFELQARDVVYVDPVPLVRWNRVISLMLPSAQAVSTTRSALN